MDNMAYLEQIAATTKPPAPKESFLHSKKFRYILGGVVIFSILIIILGSIFGGGGNDKERDAIMHLNLRTANLIKTLDIYNEQVKASSLRSLGSALSTQLTDLNRDISAYVKENWKNKIPDEIKNKETDFINNLNNTLEVGRLNGYLDRVFVREFVLQIVLLNSLQTEILDRTKNESLINTINTALPNFKELHTQFEDYSDPSS